MSAEPRPIPPLRSGADASEEVWPSTPVMATTAGREAWLTASVEVSQLLLDRTQHVGPVVQRIIDHVRRLSRARTVTFVGPSAVDDADFEVRLASGAGAAELARMHYPKKDTLEGRAMQENRGFLSTAAESYCHHTHVLTEEPAGPLLAVPFDGSEDMHGAIVVSRGQDSPRFDEDELAMTEDFARQATVALQLADANANREQLRFREQHDLQTRQLHDELIQQLFGLGLTLTALRDGHPGPGPQATTDPQLWSTATNQLDTVIARLRTTLTSSPEDQV